jgi:putative transport protein
VATAAKSIGVIVSPSNTIDFVVLGLAIFFGGLVGVLISFPIGGITIALSTSVGTLLAGLLVGYLRTRLPHFGRIPDGAVSLMTSLGLAAFVGLTGIHAGPIFLSALRDSGIGLLLGGMAVTLLPQIVGFCVGHFLLRMNPILLLGALTGAQTVTAAMAAIQERSGSAVVVLGYTPAYPVSNILLTTWGSVMVVVFAG